jgi:hypothetical protein
MVSYAWSDDREHGVENHIARTVAQWLPRCWLDVNELIPGTPVTKACSDAASRASFRFVLIGVDYLRSHNCR